MNIEAPLTGLAKGPTSSHSEMDVYERTVLAGGRIIAVNNISFVDLIDGKDVIVRKILLIIVSILLVIIGLFSLRGGFGLLLILGGGIGLWIGLRMSTKFYLSIATNDGSRTVFVGSSRGVLQDAQNFLHAKIDSNDTKSTIHFNFNNSQISGSAIGDNININK